MEFQLFAPQNKAASLMGCFSNWQEIPMQKDELGYFKTQIDLADGIYQYKFRVQSNSWFLQPDEWVEINDPYVTELDCQTENGIIRIKEGQKIVDSFVWQYDEHQPLPLNHELIIYEIQIANFCSSDDDPKGCGKFNNVIAKLDYLQELGINTIELMPVNQCPGNYSWGYTPSYFFALEPNLGTTEELKQLIDQCHRRGIRVILDQVYNHSSEESPLLKLDRDYWYYHDRHHPENSRDYWGPEFNYDYYDEQLNCYPARKLMIDAVRFWVQEYHLDGIRYDAVKLIDNYEFLHQLTEAAISVAGDKPFYNIGECVPEETNVVRPNGPMDGTWHDHFCHCIRDQIIDQKFQLEEIKAILDAKRKGYPVGVTKVINFVDNHDQDRFLANLGDQGIFDEAAFRRVKLAITLLMTSVGIPLIWMGEEVGERSRKEPNEPLKLDWDLLKNPLNQDLFQYYQRLIELRKKNPALTTVNIDFFYENPDDKILAYVRWDYETCQILVIANFSDQALKKYSIPNILTSGIWQDYISQEQIEVKDHHAIVNLKEYEAKIFVLQ